MSRDLFETEVINTRHYIAREKGADGKNKNAHRFVIHRRLFLTAKPGVVLFSTPRNVRISLTRHGFSLSGRVETKPSDWWDKSPVKTAAEYTRLKDSHGRQRPTMNRDEALKWLSLHLGGLEAAEAAIDALENTEALEGDDRWEALAKYGYEIPQYEDEDEAVAA